MTASKLKIWLKETLQKVKENVVPIVGLIVPGIVIGGSFVALHDSKRISKLEKRLAEHVQNNNDNVDTLAEWHQRSCDDFEQIRGQIADLTRQNNILMEKALQETEGKAS